MSNRLSEIASASMAAATNDDRSLASVLQNIVRNVQEIVRLEISLAKSEIRQEIGNVKSAVVLSVAGAVLLFLSSFFLLEAAYLALTLVAPAWAAALIVGAGSAVLGGLAIVVSRSRFRACYPAKKEGVHWTEASSKLKSA